MRPLPPEALFVRTALGTCRFAPLFLITYDTTFASTAEKTTSGLGALVGSLGRQDRTGLSRESLLIPHYSLFLVRRVFSVSSGA